MQTRAENQFTSKRVELAQIPSVFGQIELLFTSNRRNLASIPKKSRELKAGPPRPSAAVVLAHTASSVSRPFPRAE